MIDGGGNWEAGGVDVVGEVGDLHGRHNRGVARSSPRMGCWARRICEPGRQGSSWHATVMGCSGLGLPFCHVLSSVCGVFGGERTAPPMMFFQKCWARVCLVEEGRRSGGPAEGYRAEFPSMRSGAGAGYPGRRPWEPCSRVEVKVRLLGGTVRQGWERSHGSGIEKCIDRVSG